MLKHRRRQRIFAGLFPRMLAIFVGLFVAADVLAGTTSLTLTAINTSLTSGVGNFVKLMQDISTVAGVGFIFSAFFKFHQHKMQPTQVPLSQGVTMLLIGAGLTVFPHLLNTTSKAVFGQSIAQVGGSDIKNVVGAGS